MTHEEKEIQTLQNQIMELEKQLAEAQAAIQALTPLARLPGENPNPVARVSNEGIVLYRNPPAAALPGWMCVTNQPLSMPLLGLVEEAFKDGQLLEKDVQLGRKFYSVVVVPIPGTGYGNVYGRDITDHRRAEEALKESERRQREITRLLELDQARLAAVLKHLPVGVWIMDQRGRLVGNNEQAERIWAGKSPPLDSTAEYQQYVAWHAESGKLLEPEEYPVAMALQTGSTIEPIELRIQRFDGSAGTVLASAAPIKDNQGVLMGVVGVNVDITERKLAEERFNKAFHASPNALVISRQEDGRIETINDTFLRLFGYEKEEVLGKTSVGLGMFANPGDRQEAVHRLRKDGFLRDFELDVQLKSGEVRSANLAVEMVEISGERMMLTTIQDITLRKLAEKALRESEERFAKAFQSSPDAILLSRLSDGLIMEVNEGWSVIFGHKPNEVVGRPTLEVGIYVNPEDRSTVVTRLIEHGSLRDFELEMRRKSGEVRQASMSAERIEINGVECLLAIIRDITEQKQAEQALRRSEERLKRAQEIAQLGSWELDLVRNQLTWSDEVYRIFGLQPQEFAASYEAFLDVVHPEDRPAVDNAYSGSIRDGKDAYEIEHRIIERSSGEIRIVHEKCEHFRDQNGQVIRSIGMVQDITERKQAEQALQESEQQFHSLADSMPQLVWTALPDGTVDYYNQRYLEYQEIRQVEGIAWEWAPVLHPDDLQLTVDAWQHSLTTGEIYQVEHRVRMADGSYRWHLSRGIPMRDEKGQIIRWFGTATDIHDLKHAEKQLKIYTERLEQSNRELEQFAFMASHDLQEPLRKIRMFGDLLLERAARLSDQERNYLDRMRNAAGRMRDMVDGLLLLSRVTTQARTFTRVDLSRVISDILSDLDEQIQRAGGKVHVEALPIVEGDPLQLHQLMQNLIGNALKYRQPDAPPEVRIYTTEIPGSAQIHVQDNGIGFDQADADRIFEPFQRLVGRTQYEGSGIGLAICRRIVERHGGTITATSKPGQGTTLIVTLPTNHPGKQNAN